MSELHWKVYCFSRELSLVLVSTTTFLKNTWSISVSTFAPRPSYTASILLPPASLLQTALWHLYARPRPGGNLFLSVRPRFPFQDTVFTMAVNAQKPSFVIDRVHFDLDSQQGLSVGLVGPCSVHFTQFLLNPVRGIGFGRSGISLGFMIWNHISFSFFRVTGRIATNKMAGHTFKDWLFSYSACLFDV